MVNNAGHDERHSIEEVTPEFWRERLAANLDHQFFCSQAVIPGMSDGKGGSIINIGSCAWHLGLGGMPAYVTAKAAIEGMTRGPARDLGAKHIRVNCVVPGFVKTERQVRKWLTPELEATIYAGQCLPELIEPAYIANMVAFLAADESRMCTAQTYAVDAGWM
jgi:NAD(P)-dependent dehydrogenase (short-subunit alcohol dehydrogenase family)